MSTQPTRNTNGGGALRAWLEYVAQSAIDWLDELDAVEADLEDEGG